MKHVHYLFTVLLLFVMVSGANGHNENDNKDKNNATTVTGVVTDAQTSEALTGVKVQLGEQVVYTDFNGQFTLPAVETGKYDLVVSMISYQAIYQSNLTVQPGHEMKFELETIK